ncbi:MAG: nucleotide exchange factor GrpE [Planctomycetota bacterium]
MHERDELLERLQRVSAEFENYQKRMKRERLKWGAEAVRGVLESMVPVLDNLDFAIAAFDKQGSDQATLRKGVEMVREELLRQLGNRGAAEGRGRRGHALRPRPAPGDQRAGGGGPPSRRSSAARPGYVIEDTVVRPAQVGVV